MPPQRERVARDDGAALAVHSALAALPRGRWLLAVSGGRDSMALLHAMARARAGEVAAVASFDHGSGAAARRAIAFVEQEAERLGLPIVTGVAAPGLPQTESAWRGARRRFLDGWAADLGATVVTAHTRDDEIETVVQRLLRDAGPRGLAGMRGAARTGTGSGGGPAPRARPLLAVSRATLAAYAVSNGVRWIDDPTNASLRFQRNRIRHELLPALERAAPGFSEWCWQLGARAAEWRAAVDACVAGLGLVVPAPGSAVLPAGAVATVDAKGWEALWPAVAAHAGVVMDRRGIARAAAWAPGAKPGQVIPLSGDARIERTAQTFVVRGTPHEDDDYILHQ